MTPSVAPNRVSYFLDLHGPSEMIDTACSSGLVAVHRGVEAIRRGEATQAIVGAASLMLTPMGHVGLSRAGMLSRRGRCRTFMSDADGYARGEGVGVLVLKPLSAARADGDPIHAVIRGSGVNHGRRAQSLTAPNSAAQADLLIDVYRRAGIDPRSVTFLEAHGTGTVLGDPVEIDGLTGAFRQLYQDWGAPPPTVPSCGLGSVKTHIGHLEVAAGISSLVKVLLQMRHRTQIANLHVGQINPHIDLTGTPFEAVRANRPWTAGPDETGREAPRRAGISSFGYGGVNAHVVVEESPPSPPDAADDGRPVALLLSARDEARLAESCRDLRDWMSRHRDGGAPGGGSVLPGRGRGQAFPPHRRRDRDSGPVHRRGETVGRRAPKLRWRGGGRGDGRRLGRRRGGGLAGSAWSGTAAGAVAGVSLRPWPVLAA